MERLLEKNSLAYVAKEEDGRDVLYTMFPPMRKVFGPMPVEQGEQRWYHNVPLQNQVQHLTTRPK